MTASSSTSPEPRPIPAGRRVSGLWRVPPSKSVTHRYLNLALLAGQALVVERPLLAEDTLLFLAALEVCGWTVDGRGRPEEVSVVPDARPATERDAGRRRTISCGNAGTLARFLVATLTALPGRWRLDGSERLRQRPVGPLVEALHRLGADLRYAGHEGCLPLDIEGGTLVGGATQLDAGLSSQFLSAVLMAGLAAPRPVVVEISSLTSAPYVEVTLAAVRQFDGSIEAISPTGRMAAAWRIEPGLRPRWPRLRVEGDASSACYPAAAAALTGGDLVIDGLRADSAQGDRRFLDLLAKMGADVAWQGDRAEVRGVRLQAVEADLSTMPDQVPTLAALAPFAAGTTHIHNVAHLRHKESDRLAAMAGELRRLGAHVEEGVDWLKIRGDWHDSPPPTDAVTVQTYGDHRIAMSLALVGLRRPGVSIGAPEVVAKSYPGFWDDLDRVL